MKVILGITGASGSIYGYTLLCLLQQKKVDVSVILTSMGERVLAYECGITRDEIAAKATLYADDDLFAPIASGSCLYDAMVVAPCSMNTLGQIAGGQSGTLLTRCASVALKEKRPLITLFRETPLNTIQINNMLRLAQAGAIIMPACPGFYKKPERISDLVGGIAYRILDQLGIPAKEAKRWQ